MQNILSKIKRGDSDLPNRVLLAGPEGIGKSTFASKAPNPLFICSEDGLTGLDHVQRISPADLPELNSLLDSLLVEPSGFKSIVVDTCDWLERFIYAGICKRDEKSNIEDYGYGKGYVVAENELVSVLQKLDAIRQKHRIGIVLLSHVQIRTFNDPRGESWERYEMKGNKRLSGILREWPDACLFATFEVFKTKKKGEQRERAIGGDRVIHTQWSPAWDAKNRLNLPETIALDWDVFEQEVQGNSTPSLRAKVKSLYATAKIPEADKPKWTKWIGNLESHTADKLKTAIEKLETIQ
jgi:hypothetical protein